MDKKKRASLNVARRRRYKNDDNYRKQQIAMSREFYRRKHDIELGDNDCRENIDLLGDIGAERLVLINPRNKIIKTQLCLLNSELAGALKIGSPTLHKWHKSGRLPVPVFKLIFGESDHKTVCVYVEEEARLIIETIGAHMAEFKHFRGTHIEVIERLKLGLFNIRKEVRNAK